MTIKGWKGIWAGIATLYILSNAPIRAQTAAPLDVMLLIDNSPSNARTDPDNLRISAAKFLLDYLEIVSQVMRFNCRAGVVNFGGDLGRVAEPLRPLQGGMVQEALRPEKIPFTDFRPPLDFSLREFRARSIDTGNNMAVILFTDGTPELAGKLLVGEDKKRYFKGETVAGDKLPAYNLKRLATELQEASAKIFVIAVGDSPEDSGLWQDLIPPNHYFSINNTTNLARIFHLIIADLIGMPATDTEDLTPAQPHLVELPPNLEQAIFSFIKARPEVSISVIDPSGKTHQSIASGRGRELHEVFVIFDPLEGNWHISVANGNAQMFMDKWLPKLEVIAPATPLGLGQPVQLNARLLRNQKTIVDSSLKLTAQIKAPSGQTLDLPFKSKPEGFYSLAVKNLNEIGNYVVTVIVELHGKPLKVDHGQTGFVISGDIPAQPNLWENSKAFWQAGLIIAIIVLCSAFLIGKRQENIKKLEADIKNYKSDQPYFLKNIDKEQLKDASEEDLKKAVELLKKDQNEAKKQFDAIIDKKTKLSGKITDNEIDNIKDFFNKWFGNFESIKEQREQIYGWASGKANDVLIKSVAQFLIERWVSYPDLMVDEFFELLREPRGIDVMNELSKTKNLASWKNVKLLRAEHLIKMAAAAYQVEREL